MFLAPYIKSAQIKLQDTMNFRVSFLIRLFTNFLYSYATVAIWYAVVTLNANSLSPELALKTIKFSILSAAIGSVVFSISGYEIASRLNEGTIARDLLYPVSLPSVLFAQAVGNAISVFITNMAPILIALSLIYGISWNPAPLAIINLCIGMLLGFILMFLVNFIIDMISFWYLGTMYCHYIKEAIMVVFCGSFVPLWFYPRWLLNIVNVLPFKDIIFTPIAGFLGERADISLLSVYGVTLLWLVILFAGAYFMWTAGVKKVVAQGG
ncbi:MAG: ABC-2 family transporter protein [Bacillota bacterium]